MTFILSIRILPAGKTLTFSVPLDLTGPGTLRITSSVSGGYFISILDDTGSKREWFAFELLNVRFEA